MKSIAVYTLVDITATGVISNQDDMRKPRNQQRNWETIHQIINLRTHAKIAAVPASPKMVAMEHHNFGTYYRDSHRCWKFIFEISDISVFKFENNELERLHYDVNNVPVIKHLDETADLPDPVFYTEGILKNTYFKILD
jgi:hypothetical protein